MREGAGVLPTQRARRRWRFADVVFDEAGWRLIVAGRPVTIERKPLLLLQALLDRAGEVVGKDALLDAVWPDVVVVEASLPTAIAKLRRALGDEGRPEPVIATVARMGYRIGVPVAVEDVNAPTMIAAQPIRRSRHLVAVAAVVLIGLLSVGMVTRWTTPAVSSEVGLHKAGVNAVRRMDVPVVERLIAQGWKPGRPIDREDNDALKLLLARCEWDTDHDRRRLLLMARTLVDGGAAVTHRNVWGDTAYSIAAAPRYCGADHPVTRMLHSLCYAGAAPPRDECLADYRRRRPLLAPEAVAGTTS